ncbi:hypothetical protein E2P61_02985 [Candidatus Bathyarchaeota archaeon]|nr:hypothetical protein E2P61_02985 [Candidatus Bathyarchaeota archaeon]
MSGFPYPDTESYPSDGAHLQYLREYNTRVVEASSPMATMGLSLTTLVAVVAMLMVTVNLGVLVYFKRRN